MLLLIADIDDIAKGVRQIARRSGILQKEFEDTLEDDSRSRFVKLLESMPIDAWTGGKGMGGVSYFQYEDGLFSSKLREHADHRPALAEFVRELCEYRLGQYLERLVGSEKMAPRVVCSVSHSNGKPSLFLPDRNTTPGIPTGWQAITAGGHS